MRRGTFKDGAQLGLGLAVVHGGELRAIYREYVRVQRGGDGPCQRRFACAGWAVQQHTTRRSEAVLRKELRLREGQLDERAYRGDLCVETAEGVVRRGIDERRRLCRFLEGQVRVARHEDHVARRVGRAQRSRLIHMPEQRDTPRSIEGDGPHIHERVHQQGVQQGRRGRIQGDRQTRHGRCIPHARHDHVSAQGLCREAGHRHAWRLRIKIGPHRAGPQRRGGVCRTEQHMRTGRDPAPFEGISSHQHARIIGCARARRASMHGERLGGPLVRRWRHTKTGAARRLFFCQPPYAEVEGDGPATSPVRAHGGATERCGRDWCGRRGHGDAGGTGVESAHGADARHDDRCEPGARLRRMDGSDAGAHASGNGPARRHSLGEPGD